MRALPDRLVCRLGVLAFALLASMPALVMAEAYVGAGVGATRFTALSTCQSSTASCDVDKYGFGWKLYGGYQFNDYFAVEGAWVDLGETSITTSNTVVSGDSTASAWRAQGIEASVLITVPFGDEFRFFQRLGALSSKTDADTTYTNLGVSTSSTGSISEINFTLGLGGQWHIGEQFGLRFEWQRYLDVGESPDTGSAEVDLILLSALFRF